MSGDTMMGAGGGGEVDFHLAQFALSVLEFQGSIRAVLNRDAGEMPRPGEIAALLQSFLEKNNFSVAGLVGDSIPLADRASEGEPGPGIAQVCAVLNAFPFMHVRLYSSGATLLLLELIALQERLQRATVRVEAALAAVAVNLQVREEWGHGRRLLRVLPRHKILLLLSTKKTSQIGRALPEFRTPRCTPVGSIQKLGREDWRADERSLRAAIAEESAQDSQYLTGLSI